MKYVNSHNNFYIFTAALVFLLLASAIVSSTPDGENHRIMQLGIFVVELVAYFSLNLGARWRWFVIIMLALMFLTNMAREFTDWSAVPMMGLLASLLFFCGMAYAAAKQVLFTGCIERNTIFGAVAVYLLLGLIWTSLYLIALEFWHDGLKGIEYKNWNDNLGITAYFSFVTMTSLGYGDISPTVPVTRTLAYLQAICGAFYLAIVMASLVSALNKQPKSSE